MLILESRSHLDLGDLPNMLAAELGVMTVRLERAIRSLDGVARVHVNRWGDGAAHLHLWFLARPYGRLQLRGTFLALWDDILPPIPEERWRENLALVAAWLAEFGGRPLAEPPRIDWQAPSPAGRGRGGRDRRPGDARGDAKSPSGDEVGRRLPYPPVGSYHQLGLSVRSSGRVRAGWSMSRRLVNLTLDTLEDLPRPCRQCVYWELDPVAAERACAAGDPGLEKEAWVSQTLLEWGSCGKLVYVDGMPAGFVMYAPPAYVPRSMAFPTSPVSADAALLMTAHVVAAFAGGGLGRMLVQGVARDLTKRGVKAIEAFGDAKFGERRSTTTAGLRGAGRLLPVGRLQDGPPAPALSRGCGWSCAPRCPGSPTSSTRWRSCSAR